MAMRKVEKTEKFITDKVLAVNTLNSYYILVIEDYLY